MRLQCFFDIGIVRDGCKVLLVDALSWVDLLNHSQHTVIEMLVEFLCVRESDGTGRAGTSGGVLCCAAESLLARDRALPSCIWWCLLDTVNRSKMPLEDIGAIKALLRRRSRAWAETANHGSLVMRQSVPVFVVLACETLDVVLAGLDGTLLRSLSLMREHMRF